MNPVEWKQIEELEASNSELTEEVQTLKTELESKEITEEELQERISELDSEISAYILSLYTLFDSDVTVLGISTGKIVEKSNIKRVQSPNNVDTACRCRRLDVMQRRFSMSACRTLCSVKIGNFLNSSIRI